MGTLPTTTYHKLLIQTMLFLNTMGIQFSLFMCQNKEKSQYSYEERIIMSHIAEQMGKPERCLSYKYAT